MAGLRFRLRVSWLTLAIANVSVNRQVGGPGGSGALASWGRDQQAVVDSRSIEGQERSVLGVAPVVATDNPRTGGEARANAALACYLAGQWPGYVRWRMSQVSPARSMGSPGPTT